MGKKWKNLVSGGDSESTSSSSTNSDGKPKPAPSFNNDPIYGNFKDRQYKRVTKQNFTDNQLLEDNAGSLWKKEGQGSFLFAQNNLRVIGDIINVEIEGKVAETLSIKANILKRSQMKSEVFIPKPQSKTVAKIPKPEESSRERAVASVTPAVATESETGAAQPAAPAEKSKDEMKFDLVPCRIVEKNSDGSYRVKGMQVFYIGKKEYKMLVTGNIRPDDISTDSISSSRVIDSKFDLVAANKDVFK